MYLIVVKNNKMKLEVTQIRHYLYAIYMKKIDPDHDWIFIIPFQIKTRSGFS
jgi:hypothetical protein